jgi:cytoskeletal protein CcmA (bactofilin family)
MNSTPFHFEGISRIEGGSYPDGIIIEGIGKINGDISAGYIESDGALSANGNLAISGELRCDGACKCKGNVAIQGAGSFGGALSIDGNLSVGQTFVGEGLVHCKGSVQFGSHATFEGKVDVDGNINAAGMLIFHGKINCKGNVIANELIVEPIHTNRLFFNNPNEFGGNVIVREAINIEKVRIAGDLQGGKVILGKDVQILGKVYYRDEIRVDPSVLLKYPPQKLT